MENAAKALSIAGGILIAVMLAVLVYYVFTHWGESPVSYTHLTLPTNSRV